MDVACLGILVADVFASPIDSLPKSGELKLTDRFLLSAGGCAANTAACLRKLGRSVAVLGKVGTDLFGDFVISDLERLGVDASTVRRSLTHPTSGTVIVSVRGEDRRYLHSTGANRDFTAADVDRAALAGARVLYFGGYMAMPGFRAEDLAEIFREARNHSVTTVLDVVIPAGAPALRAEIAPILPFTDYFLPNEDEAQRLTGCSGALEQARSLSRQNPAPTVVITRGRLGSLARCGQRVIETEAFAVDSIDESGAGDAFTAGFITGLLEGWPLEYTLRFAGAVGASCTRAVGCTAGVFRLDEAVAFVGAHPAATQRAFDDPVE